MNAGGKLHPAGQELECFFSSEKKGFVPNYQGVSGGESRKEEPEDQSYSEQRGALAWGVLLSDTIVQGTKEVESKRRANTEKASDATNKRLGVEADLWGED